MPAPVRLTASGTLCSPRADLDTGPGVARTRHGPEAPCTPVTAVRVARPSFRTLRGTAMLSGSSFRAKHGRQFRVSGTIRRECLDHMIVLNEASLYRHVKSFLACYHESRT